MGEIVGRHRADLGVVAGERGHRDADGGEIRAGAHVDVAGGARAPQRHGERRGGGAGEQRTAGEDE